MFYNLKEISKKEENEKIKNLNEKYVEYIKQKNEENKSASKNFFIIICYESSENKDISQINTYLNEGYFKIKETLSRCGNIVYDCNRKEEVQKILISFFKKEEEV